MSTPGPRGRPGHSAVGATWQTRGLGAEGLGPARVTRLASGGTESNSRVLPNRLPSRLPGEEIYRLLEDGRPRSALNIAKAVGKKTAKEVNPDLYAMQEEHLLDYDKNSKAWTVYRPGRSLPAAHTWAGEAGKRNPGGQQSVLLGTPLSPLPALPVTPSSELGLADRSLGEGSRRRSVLAEVTREDFLEVLPEAAVAEGKGLYQPRRAQPELATRFL